jgi:hypothetical protein
VPWRDRAAQPPDRRRARQTSSTFSNRGHPCRHGAARQHHRRHARTAGDDFRETFQRAHLDPLRAANLERIGFTLIATPSSRIEAARDRVWQTIKMIGGLGSPAGSCLWHVIGLEQSLKQWAMLQEWRRKQLDQETASGILIGSLGMLEALSNR